MRRALFPFIASQIIACASPEPNRPPTDVPAGDDTGNAGPGETGGGTREPLFETHPPEKSIPLHVVGGFSIDVPKETLQPGDEKFPCYIYPLEIKGPSRVVGGAKLTVGPGMHHGNIVTRPKTGEGFRPCPADDSATVIGAEAESIFAGGAVLFGSSTQVQGEEWQRFPDGMGFPIQEDFEIVASMHYLNATSDPVDVAPRYEWFTVDEGKIEHLLAPFAWMLHDFEIPPMSDYTLTGECKIPGPMHLVHVLPHMHRMGRAFTADLVGGEHDGLQFLNSPGYDPENGVMLEYEPPLDLSVAERFRFACSWHNTLDKPLHYGVGDNEMCFLFGFAYPPEHAYTAISTGGNSCLLLKASQD